MPAYFIFFYTALSVRLHALSLTQSFKHRHLCLPCRYLPNLILAHSRRWRCTFSKQQWERDDFQLSHWIVELNLSETDVSTFFPLRAFLFCVLCTLIFHRFITIVLGNLYYSRCHPGVVRVCVCVFVCATLCAITYTGYTGSGAVRRPVFVCHDICNFGKRRSQR